MRSLRADALARRGSAGVCRRLGLSGALPELPARRCLGLAPALLFPDLVQEQALPVVSSQIGAAHSFFCVFDGTTGQNVSCPESSSDHFFFSAIVDHTRGEENQTVWVFGSAWNRANRTAAVSPGARGPADLPDSAEVGVRATAERRSRSSPVGWGSWGSGPCDDASRGVGPGCHVGAWSSRDMKTWQFSKAVTFPVPQTTANPGASIIPISSQPTPAGRLARHQAFMALEGGPLAINTGKDGDLHQGWELLAPNYTTAPRNPKRPDAGSSGGFGLPCPSARYNPLDNYYYVFGGGVDIQLRRSRDLSAHSWSEPVLMATGCAKSGGSSKYNQTDASCTASVGNNMTRIAPGYFTEYWASSRGRKKIPFLGNMSAWDWGTSDADFTDQGGKGPTRFIFVQNWQGKPPGWVGSGGGFYQVGVFEGTEFEWLSSYFAA